MYKVIVRFKDLQDSEGHIYEVGDTFPRSDMEVDDKRIAELIGNKNKLGKPIIEKVKVTKNVDVDGTVSGTEELVRQESDEVAREVRNKRRKSDIT